jgi:hypothetical protein
VLRSPACRRFFIKIWPSIPVLAQWLWTGSAGLTIALFVAGIFQKNDVSTLGYIAMSVLALGDLCGSCYLSIFTNLFEAKAKCNLTKRLFRLEKPCLFDEEELIF